MIVNNDSASGLRHCFVAFLVLTYLILIPTYPHFIDDKIEAQR